MKLYRKTADIHRATVGSLTIRQMKPDDLSRIMHLWLDCNVKTHNFIPVTYWRGHNDDVKQSISEAEVYICEKSGLIVGFIGLSGYYVAGLFVDPDYRSQGIGRLLLNHVKAIKSRLQLHVYCKNIRAVRFYQREGFVAIAEHIDPDTGENEILMNFGKQ